MRYVFFAVSFCLISSLVGAQQPVYSNYSREPVFDDDLEAIIRNSGLDSLFNTGDDGMQPVSFAVIDLTKRLPVLGGFHLDHFIYPASVYKMYVAMEVLKQIDDGEYSLFSKHIVKSSDQVGGRPEISWDPRPVLKVGDTPTINYLLDLMITRNDNTAANCLIDIAGRERINSTIRQNNWNGSEVTRKFLRRDAEDPGYDTIRGTTTNALHAADFMYKIYSNKLITPWVSKELKTFLGRQLDTTKLQKGLPSNTVFYHKTGWWGSFTNDVGIVEDGDVQYIIALFTPLKEEDARPRMEKLSEDVYNLMKQRRLKTLNQNTSSDLVGQDFGLY